MTRPLWRSNFAVCDEPCLCVEEVVEICVVGWFVPEGDCAGLEHVIPEGLSLRAEVPGVEVPVGGSLDSDHACLAAAAVESSFVHGVSY